MITYLNKLLISMNDSKLVNPFEDNDLELIFTDEQIINFGKHSLLSCFLLTVLLFIYYINDFEIFRL
jgi:hypothetical protein